MTKAYITIEITELLVTDEIEQMKDYARKRAEEIKGQYPNSRVSGIEIAHGLQSIEVEPINILL